MRGRLIKVILVEDDEDDYIIVRDLLAEVAVAKFQLEWVVTYEEALERIGSTTYDICLLDFRLGTHNGLELLRELLQRGYRKPIILLTGQGDYEVDVEAMEAGAADYLTKGQLNAPLLERSIRYAIEHSRAQQALRESEERFVLFMQYLPGAALIKDSDGRILYTNEYFARIFGQQPWQLIGKSDFDLWHQEVAARMRQADQAVLESRRAVERVDEVEHHGSQLTYLTYRFPILRENAMPLVGVISVDISARRRAEEHVRILNQQLIKTQENERQKLARDLHDVIGQDLSALKFGLECLFQDFPEIPEGLRARAVGLSATLRTAHQNVRDLAHQLGASGLAHLGLASAAGDLCERFAAQNNIEVAFTALGMENNELVFDVKINLYRILQESLNNVLKHAEASTVVVRLVRSFPNIIMRVEDNGRGFDVEERLATGLAEQRMGLRSMEERVALLQGRMKIDSQPGRGTRILVEVPQQPERRKLDKGQQQ